MYDCRGIGPLVLNDDLTVDRSSRTDWEVYSAKLSAQVQPNADSASQCKWLKTIKKLQKQSKSFSCQRNVIFFSGHVSHLILTDTACFPNTEHKKVDAERSKDKQ